MSRAEFYLLGMTVALVGLAIFIRLAAPHIHRKKTEQYLAVFVFAAIPVGGAWLHHWLIA